VHRALVIRLLEGVDDRLMLFTADISLTSDGFTVSWRCSDDH